MRVYVSTYIYIYMCVYSKHVGVYHNVMVVVVVMVEVDV